MTNSDPDPRLPDSRMMARAIGLAERGRGLVHPNPLVGAVIVRDDGKILGEGHHERFGDPHAEVSALAAARACGATRDDLARSALYVTLEPCAHEGKTPPCVAAVLDAGIRAVHIALADPNRHGTEGGAARLRGAGVAVTEGTLLEQARAQNGAYLRFLATGRPRVTVKIASSLDGKVAARDGSSRWITGDAARRAVDGMRRAADAVVTGIGTVLADDPGLRVRVPIEGVPPRDPGRVVLDAEARTPPASRLVRENADGATTIFVADDLAGASAERATVLSKAVCVERIPRAAGEGLDLDAAFGLLARQGKIDLLVEAGPRLVAAILRADRADRMTVFLAPTLLGGTGNGWSDSLEVASMTEAPRRFRVAGVRPVGDDAMLVLERCSPA